MFELPLNAIHTSLLPTGNVLMWGRIHENDIPIVWNPVDQTYTTVPTPGVDVFCAGHTFMADGSLLVAGGHIAYDVGTKDMLAFDSFRSTWKRLPDMTIDRWYAGTVNLQNGSIYIAGGSYIDPDTGLIKGRQTPEVYDPETNLVSSLSAGYFRDIKYYPNIYPLTDGKLMMHRPVMGYRKFNPFVTNNTWSGTDNMPFTFEQFTFARYRPNKAIGVSSIRPSEFNVIGLFDANTNLWTQLPSSIGGRRDADVTILANGSVLISGGSSEFAVPSTATMPNEIYDPSTGLLTVDAAGTVPRVYHSSAVLLPDGSVLKVGSGSGGSSQNVRQKNGEIYYPPYYFSPTRPVITYAPDVISYGATISFSVSTTKKLREAALIRLGSATHGMNYSQFYTPLSLTTLEPASSNSFKMPTSKGDTPPGPYMLVVVNEDGVPSVAKMVTVGSDLAKPILTNFAPRSGSFTGITQETILAADSNVATLAVTDTGKNVIAGVGEFEFTSTRRSLNSLRLRVSSRWAMGGTVKAELWNYYLGAWDNLGQVNAGVNGGSNLVTNWFTRRLNAKEYVHQSTKKIRVKLTFKNPSYVRPASNVELDMVMLYPTF